MRYLIIGNGVAGITAALTLRAREADASIVVVSGESEYFFSRTALMYAFMDRLNPRDLEPYERKVWARQRIQRLRDWVVDLNAGERTVMLRDGGRLSYDQLLLATGSVPNRPAWQSAAPVREGLVNFISLQDLEACERLTRSGGEAVVVGGGLIGIELVECLRHHGMNVTFLVREPWYWPVALAEPEGRMISEHIRGHGVNIVHGETVDRVELDAAGGVTGVRCLSGRQCRCSLLGVAVGVAPATAWLNEVRTPPLVRRGIVVDPAFRTSLENVFACGDCAEIQADDRPPFVEQIWYSAKRQGELAALSMLGDAVTYVPPVFFNSAKFFDIEFTTVGAFGGGTEFYARAPGREASVRIAERSGMVTGFNMLGARWDHTVLERWIAERRSLQYVIRRLHEAQFDVEFGRLDLRPVRAML